MLKAQNVTNIECFLVERLREIFIEKLAARKQRVKISTIQNERKFSNFVDKILQKCLVNNMPLTPKVHNNLDV